jgi:hypothetical protein
MVARFSVPLWGSPHVSSYSFENASDEHWFHRLAIRASRDEGAAARPRNVFPTSGGGPLKPRTGFQAPGRALSWIETEVTGVEVHVRGAESRFQGLVASLRACEPGFSPVVVHFTVCEVDARRIVMELTTSEPVSKPWPWSGRPPSWGHSNNGGKSLAPCSTRTISMPPSMGR